jgi:MFS family permease
MIPWVQPFVRDRLTWLAYAMLAYIGFSQSMLGPLMPFLRSELHLNYTLGGFLPATLALGLILSGLFGDWFARLWSRRIVFWMGGIGLAICVALLGLSHQFELVLVAVLGMGIGSSLTQVMIQALLADQHGEQRAIAFTESNVAASLSVMLTPFVIGSLQGANVSWRAISILVILFLAILAVFFLRDPVPDSVPTPAKSPTDASHLPFSFWLYWIVLFLVVAVEMSLAVWATDFLANVAGLSRINAALAFSAFPAAMLIGRIAGSRSTRRWSSIRLLVASLGITLIGFLIFWLTHISILNILGLFIAGLGIANLYPLTLSIAVGLVAGQSNRASARISLGVGSALLTVPLLLGWLADQLGLQKAYGFVTILMLMAMTIIAMNNRLPLERGEASPL